MKKKIIFALITVAAVCLTGCKKEPPKTQEELYSDAVKDAAFADEDEILTLVSLTESDPMTTWQDGKVLLLTWHNYSLPCAVSCR